MTVLAARSRRCPGACCGADRRSPEEVPTRQSDRKTLPQACARACHTRFRATNHWKRCALDGGPGAGANLSGMRRAKIVCTIGPASSNPGDDSGPGGGRHGLRAPQLQPRQHEDHAKVARILREVAARAGRPVAILADLSGPKMRVGRFPGGPIELVPGRPFVLTARDVPGDRASSRSPTSRCRAT